MNKIKNIFKNYKFKTGILILISLFFNKLVGKYFSYFLRTQRLINSNISFTEIKQNTIRIKYKNLNIHCRKFSSDINVFHQIFLDNEFGQLHEIITNQNLKIKTILDLGGNIGMASLWFQSMYNDLEIYIVEPDTSNFKILEKNLKINKIKSININKGIWKDSRKLYFDKSFRDGQNWSITLTEKPISKEFILSISIDDLINQYNIKKIDLLKIDVEGGETMIFYDINKGLQFLKITKIIAIEIHKEFDIRDKIQEILLNNNFTFYESGEYFIGINEAI